MQELGLGVSYWIIVLLWVARTIFLALICIFLAWLGVRVLDALNPRIHKRQLIGQDPIATGLFIAGFFILVGLVIHGVSTSPTVLGGPLLEYFFNFRLLGLLAIGFVVSLLIGVTLFHLVDKLTPKIPFVSINQHPIAVGIYVFGYLLFLGLILHAALTTPL